MAHFKNFKLQVFLLGLILYFVSVAAVEKQLYKISLHEPYNSERNETVKLLNNTELVAEGNIKIRYEYGQKFYDSIVMYIADKNGYRVRFQIKPSLFEGLGLSGAALKIAAG